MKKIIGAICIGFLCTLIMGYRFDATEAALAGSVIRLHVLANSDSAEDQALKLKVRDRVIEETDGIFTDSENVVGAKSKIEGNIDFIKDIAKDEIRKNGYDYDVNVSLGMSDFPTKEYGNIILPAGSYEALKIEIGDAKGKNWWCVLFPPLCFVDETCVTPSSEAMDKIEDSLGEDGKEFVSKDKSSSVEFRFKTYEMWQNGKQRIAMWLKF
ncbi:MAG: stage II sporulation protein R [Clostridia bacterium]|nr:stage II sporulation protein R [Clostridia bacterium]